MSLILAGTACKLGRDDDGGAANEDQLESGESLGSIDRLPGGTPVSTDVRTLMSARCENGMLVLRTNREEITSPMECGQMLPESVVARFISQPVAIRAEDGRVIVESATQGTMSFPAPEPTRKDIESAP
jgi:hypothetical protein